MPEPTDKPPQNSWSYISLFALMLFWFGLIIAVFSSDSPNTTVPYSEFKNMLRNGTIAQVKLDGQTITIVTKADANVSASPTSPSGARSHPPARTTFLPEMGDPNLMDLLEQQQVEVVVTSPAARNLSSWFASILPWIVLIGVYIWFIRRMSPGGMGGRFGQGGFGDFVSDAAQKSASEPPSVRFDDVAGQDSAKREVSEILDFLKQPERFAKVGAEAPRGVLLMGPPGTGKTLLARALAGEAGVPFFNISASEFIEVFVGVGASRVRHMFEEAKKRAPCIIFIDELDSVGRVRGTGFGGGHDEREQTLNQILSEMDGFSGREAIVVLAATNRPDVLDPALLRPGRFDRHVTLELPDTKARHAILKVHTRNIPLADDVDLDTIAAGTPGFSGADLKNLANEAAILAAREGASKVNMRHMDTTRDRVIMGTVRTLAIQPEERHRLAVHEAGHTAVAYFSEHADPIYKVTIIPRGRALGSTHMLPEEERHTLPREYLMDRVAVMLGGRAAEIALLDSVSSGADDDIQQATKLARAMVARWGMSDKIGPVDLRQSDEHPFLGRDLAMPRGFSDATAQAVDDEVRALLDEATKKAQGLITDHREAVSRLVDALEQRETLDKEDIEKFLGPEKDPRVVYLAKSPQDT